MEVRKRDCRNLSRTQVCIVNALLRLMQRDDFSALTVKEVVAEAEVARSTFYLNYKSKEDVLASYVEELFAQFADTIPREDGADAYLLALCHFRFWAGHLDVIELLSRQGLMPFLLERYEAWMDELAGDFPAFQAFGIRTRGEAEERYLQAFCAAGLWNLLKRWAASGARETPEQMAQMYQRWTSAPGKE